MDITTTGSAPRPTRVRLGARRLAAEAALIPLLVAALPSRADLLPDDTRFVVGAALGYGNFSFPEKLDHTVSFPAATLTLGATTGRWQMTVNAGTSLQDADLSEEEDVGEASRSDVDVTIGYRLHDAVSVFGGYTGGKTRMSYVERDSLDDGRVPVRQNESYSEAGFFFGVSYGRRFESAGSMSLSLAYAVLTATNDFVANTDEPPNPDDPPEPPMELDDVDGRVEGDLAGFSLALAWTMPVASDLLFQTKFKFNAYRQDIEFEGASFDDVGVDFGTLSVGLAYVL